MTDPIWRNPPKPVERNLECTYCYDKFATAMSLRSHTLNVHRDLIDDTERARLRSLVWIEQGIHP